MRRTRKILTIAFLATWIITQWSCRKEYPKSELVGEPMLYFRATIDGTPQFLEAGSEKYYMYSSNSTNDSTSVLGYQAELKPVDCSDCRKVFSLKINSDLKGPQREFRLKPVQYNYYQKGPKIIAAFKLSHQGPLVKTIDWKFGDGAAAMDSAVTHTFAKPGTYNVCLRTETFNGCVSNICNQLVIAENAFSAYVHATKLNGNSVSYAVHITGGTPPYSQFWDFGDGETNNQSDPTHTYKYAGGYPVRVLVTDAANQVITVNFNAVAGNDQSSCAVNFNLSGGLQPVFEKEDALSEVFLTWKDENGLVYSSDGGPQPGDSFFKILSVEDFDSNEKGEKTKKLHIQFKCLLYNGTKSVLADNGDAVICVSY